MDSAHRARLKAALEVVRLFLLQAFDFHVDDYVSSIIGGRGNFLEFISWYGKNVERVGRVFNDNIHATNQITSPKIQKELVRACLEETRKVIVDEIGDGNFSLFLDESINEQMAVIVRFVNKKGQVIERFLGVEHVSDNSAPSLKVALNDLFLRHGLSLSRVRGLGYNRESNMREEFSELKTLILNENPFAFYVHCFVHQLQLVVVTVAKRTPAVADFFYNVKRIVNVVGARCEIHDALLQKHHEKIVEKLKIGDIFQDEDKYQETNLARPDDTCWGSYYTTLIRLLVMWESVCEVLLNVHEYGIFNDEKAVASGSIERMEDFEFIFILHLMIKVLGLTSDLSNALQQNDQNIVKAMMLTVSVKDLIQDLKENGRDALFKEVESFCTSISVPVPNMEDKIPVRGRSRRRREFTTYHHYYHVDIFNAVIDSIAVEISYRFNETSTELLRCIACLDPRDSFSRFDHGMLLRLAHIYSDDFFVGDIILLKEQLRTYIYTVRRSSEFSNCHDLASLSMKMVETGFHLIFQLVYHLIELALILPVTTATIERVFSAMNIVETDLRNQIDDEWLNDTMVCYVERDLFAEIDQENILERFLNMQACKI